MAITDAYATVAEYKDRIKVRGHIEDDATTLLQLTAVSRFLEHELGRHFTVDVSDVAQTFLVGEEGRPPPGGRRYLTIPDLSAAPTSIKIDTANDGSFTAETALVAGDFVMQPRNALVGPEPRPFDEVWLTPYGTTITWTEGVAVEILGKWGWAAIPDAIKQSTIELTSILRGTGRLATRGIALEGGVGEAVEASPAAHRLVIGLSQVYQRWSSG